MLWLLFFFLNFLEALTLSFLLVEVVLVALLPGFDLVFLKKVVMIHELEVLEVVRVALADAFFAVRHDSEEHLSLQEGQHKELHVLSVDVPQLFVA